MKFEDLASLYQYFDDLVTQEVDADVLFASSYVRGFVSLAASEYGDDSQRLTVCLAENIGEKIDAARSELSPQDREIIKRYWADIKGFFIH